VRHDLFLYGDDDTMVAKMVPFLRDGLASGEPALVVLDRRKRELLSDALGTDGAGVSYLDRDRFYTRPEDVLARYDLKLRQMVRDGASEIRAFAELPPCEPGADLDTWVAYEAIVNRAFEHHPLWVICGYDSREVSEALLEGGLETHQDVLNGDWARSARYRTPEAVVRMRTPPPAALEKLHVIPVDGGPRVFRDRLSAELSVARVPHAEVGDMLLAAGEVLVNAHQHGGEHVTVRAGRVGDRFVCEVSDDGPGTDDPLVGFVPPRPRTSDGAGLWVARQLTRQLELVPTLQGFSVRLWAGAGA
jgi:anti-sigma regulatory factor (Ser/Thr protein kinase)